MAVTLILGGARSGKSVHAEELVRAQPPPWIYVATGEARDLEMADRIAVHQLRRGDGWMTLDHPIDVAQAVSRRDLAGRPMLVDCLTLWVSNLLLAKRDIADACSELEAALSARDGDTVLVANEVGLGIVPDHALARRFRDEAGRVNQRIASLADRVTFVVAGLPMTVK